MRTDEGSTASTPTRWPAPVSRVPSASMNVDLPTPGTPEMPTRTARPDRDRASRSPSSVSSSRAAARWAACDDSTSVIACETAARRPSRIPSTSAGTSTGRPWDLISGRSCAESLSSRSSADSAITVPGRNTAAAPISLRRGHVVGRDHPTDHDHDVGASLLGERLLQRGEQGQVARRQRGDADDVHVGVDRLLGDLLGRREQRAHVDVEAHVGERADHDLLAAVVAVLAHLGDQDARAAALGLLERRRWPR